MNKVKVKKRVAVIGLTLSSLLPMQAIAGSYQALCGGVKCTIRVTPSEIRSTQGSIPTSRVAYWSVNGESSTSVGTGVATTILFGGIGLLGFLAKNHNFDFMIDGFDADGNKVAMEFKFKNNKPVKRITSELYRVTGLGMGQQRSIADIKAIESGEATLGALNTSNQRLGSSMVTKSPSCARVLQSFDCNYDTYLEANPSVAAWAKANPELATKERIRLGAYSQDETEKKEDKAIEVLNQGLGKLKSSVETNEASKCGLKLQPYGCSYDAYLHANPGIVEWAESNPELAAQERVKLQSVD